MDKVEKFIQDAGLTGLLLIMAATVGGFAAIGGYLGGQTVSGDVRELKWLEAQCWFEPCSIGVAPRFPWESFSSIDDMPRVPFPVVEAIAVGRDNTLVVVGEKGDVYRAPPPYEGWEKLSLPRDLKLKGLFGDNSVAVGPDSAIVLLDGYDSAYRASPPYERWEKISAPVDPSEEFFLVISVAVGPDNAIVLLGGHDSAYRAPSPYEEWQQLSLPVDLISKEFFRIRSVAVGPDNAIVVIIDREGVYRTVPPYEDWDYLSLPEDFSEARSVAQGPSGVVVAIRDDRTVGAWVTVTPPLLTWILLAILISSAVASVPPLAQAWRRRGSSPDIVPLESDVPVKGPEQATKAADNIAKRISAFMRNPDTPAPLTFALTGRWGSGKSSLMKLVERELVEDHCPCVWFNAWHHQSETHLFAALMESIRSNVVPRSPLGYFEFYINLVRLRFRGKRIATTIFVALMVVILGLLLTSVLSILSAIDWADTFSEIIGSIAPSIWGPPSLLVLGFLGWKSRSNPLRPFGVTPASLLRTSVAWFKFPDFQSRLSFRHEFGRAFGEVCEAFGDRRLVVIIDDLDRCSPNQVAVILEAINFLISNGDCFVLLGIDEDHVRCAVDLHYRDFAAELSRSKRTESNSGENTDASLQPYASAYLEKVINIRIQVPVVDKSDLEELRRLSGTV